MKAIVHVHGDGSICPESPMLLPDSIQDEMMDSSELSVPSTDENGFHHWPVGDVEEFIVKPSIPEDGWFMQDAAQPGQMDPVADWLFQMTEADKTVKITTGYVMNCFPTDMEPADREKHVSESVAEDEANPKYVGSEFNNVETIHPVQEFSQWWVTNIIQGEVLGFKFEPERHCLKLVTGPLQPCYMKVELLD